MTTALAFGLESELVPQRGPPPRTEITVGRDATASAGTVITVASAKDA
jgi:hypothetical protein